MNLLNWFFPPPTRDQFARALIAEFRRAGDRREHHYEPAEFRIKVTGGGEINLVNLYHEYAQLPRKARRKRLLELVRSFMTATNDLPEDFDEVRPNLRPKIWTRAAFSEMELRRQLDGAKQMDLPLYPLGSHLVTTLVYDLPTSMRSISEEDLQNWGISYYEAMEIARENLAETTAGYSQIGDGFYSEISGDSYDSARILLTDRILSWNLQGHPVAMVPQRDTLFVTGSEDEVGLKILAELTDATMRDEARPLSPIPLQFVDGEWEDWIVPRSHELYEKFQQMETSYLGGLYATQKELLDAIHDKDGTDVFVATFSAIRHESGRVLSYCVWTSGIESLLPRTNLIMIGEDHGAYDWDKVMEVAGELLELQEDLYPVRYRVTRTPTPEQLEKIGQAAL